MWIFRELARLLEKIALAVLVALALAAIQAPLRDGSFLHGFRLSCLVLGAILLLMAGVGRGSNFERQLDHGIAHAALGRIPGLSTLRVRPEDPTLTPGAVLGGAGLVLLALGALL